MSASPRARVAVLAAPALAALLGVAACSSGSSASSVSSTTPSTSPTTSPATTAPAAGGSATDSAGAVASSAASVASSASGQAAAIAQCLKSANLPTPTSSNPAGSVAEIAKLVADPATRAALQKCGISLPGLGAASS